MNCDVVEVKDGHKIRRGRFEFYRVPMLGEHLQVVDRGNGNARWLKAVVIEVLHYSLTQGCSAELYVSESEPESASLPDFKECASCGAAKETAAT